MLQALGAKTIGVSCAYVLYGQVGDSNAGALALFRFFGPANELFTASWAVFGCGHGVSGTKLLVSEDKRELESDLNVVYEVLSLIASDIENMGHVVGSIVEGIAYFR